MLYFLQNETHYPHGTLVPSPFVRVGIYGKDGEARSFGTSRFGRESAIEEAKRALLDPSAVVLDLNPTCTITVEGEFA